MKYPFLFALLAVVTCAFANTEELAQAEPCNEDLCKLPECRCSSTNIPGGLNPRDTPQFVTVTFDDAVTAAAMPSYREILYNRRNSNNCPAGATFYVSHEWTDYSMVNELYNNGFEIALHSISHQIPQTFWAQATYNDLKMEIADQRQQIAHLANIPESEVNGVRLPFLQLNGDNSYRVIKDYNLGYDYSWPTISFTNPGLWPYTLDYASTQDCPISPCPTSSIPGAWVKPIVAWFDLQNYPCSFMDACAFVPDREDADAWFNFIVQNFERHYLGNRAPFTLALHESYVRAYPGVKEAMIRFLDLINNLPDVFMENSNTVMEWVKNPIPIDEYRARRCRTWLPSACRATFCALTAAHNNWNYYMTVCDTCPRVYPWLGNPLGQ